MSVLGRLDVLSESADLRRRRRVVSGAADGVLQADVAGDGFWCVLDEEVRDGDVCHFADSPTVQQNLDGDRDECAREHDLEGLYRSFDCTVSLGGTTVEGMVVDHGAQVVLPGRDRCRLRAALLMTDPRP